ncbi:efflux RND transporter periplasmic adaptor subunit [Paenibacillus sp. 2TAB26]|uniref:efflux RND transporter periplasmic adaptor subunit n=1 Tax=Paenibacillus sp. 2TAB26 TaxID=3233005 RepID=UPI003F9AD355
MELEKEPPDRRRKRNILVVFFILMGLLLFFTLLSNTLQSLALPKVSTEKPVKGSLALSLEGSGILQPIAQAKLSNPAGWKVRKVLVKENDRVTKGQKLILYDSKSAERELLDEKTNLDKQKIEQQNMQDQFIQTMIEGDELKIRKARRDLETMKLDLSTQQRKIDDLKERLISQKEITAPFDGIITQLNAVEGLAPTGEPDVVISNSSLGYRLDITVDSRLLTSFGLSSGVKIEVEVDTAQKQQTHMLGGMIDEVVNAEPRTNSSSSEDAGQTKTVPQHILRIKVANSELKGGEQAKIKLDARSQQEGLLISNEAIHNDQEGIFINKLEVQRGALGNAYVVRKVRVPFSEKNDIVTMIQADNLYEDELIILESSEPLQDGNRVRLQ